MIVQDYKERIAAAVPGDKNIIVEASAGTGKTTLLAYRLCYLILGKGLKFDEIVALTFTDKAAAEMKLRLISLMRAILADLSLSEAKLEITKNLTGKIFNKTKEELIKEIEDSFEFIERSQICTIHSFALQLLKLYPLQAGLAPGLEIDSGFIADYVFNKNWSVFLEEELSLNGKHRTLWERLLKDFSLEKLKEFAYYLKEPYFNYCSFESSLEQVNAFLFSKISHAKTLLNSKEMPAKLRKVEVNLKEAILRLEELSKNISTLNKTDLLKLPVKEDIAQVALVKGWQKEEIDEVNNFIDLANCLTPVNLDLLEQTYNLFSGFIRKFNQEMLKNNVLSYNQSILLARDLVQKNLAVRNELKRRYKSLLIDEFQDTDVAQGQLLLFLAEAQNSHAKTWQDIILEPGKLFVVGDPKQSIYRFRGANISAYQKFLELMQKQGARTCYLTTNFRSQGKIIDFVNKWGSYAIKPCALIQPGYINLERGFKKDGKKVEFLQITCKEKQKADDIRANAANIVASWIKENVGKKQLADGRILTYKDITILYPARTGINIYTDALARFNIPYNLESGGNFYEAQEIIDILNILKVIYDPQDKLALIGVLRSPLCAMKDDELLSLYQQKALNIFARDFKASDAVKNLYKLLRSLNLKAGHITLKELIAEIFYDSDFLVLQTLATRSEQALANLQKFEHFVLENQDKGLTLGQLLLYIQTYGKNDKDESQNSLLEETFDVVNIMTIHKAKGLQAPVVILVDSGYQETKTKESFYIDTLSGQIGLCLGGLKNLNYFILEQQEALHKKAQNERLLYVALTRAEEELLIEFNTFSAKGMIEKSLKQASCAPTEDVLQTDIFTTTNFEYKDPQSFILQKTFKQEQKQILDWSLALPVWQKRKEEFLSYQKEEFVAPSHLNEQNYSAQAALDIGSLIHKALNIYFTTGKFDLTLAMQVLDLQDKTLLAPCQKILDIFERGEILKNLKTMDFLGSEIPFSMYENGVLVNGVIDALFKDKQDTLFIVDFKTDKINNKDLKSYSLKSQPQLLQYKQAVKKMFKNKEVKSFLAYLSQDILFEL